MNDALRGRDKVKRVVVSVFDCLGHRCSAIFYEAAFYSDVKAA